jgi:DNA-binding NarL/FixJ family response regulator
MPETLPTLATDPDISTHPIQVVVADGQGLVRAGFRVLLERQDGMVVAGEARNAAEAVAESHATAPDVVLLDVDLPGGGGIEAARRILDESPDGATRVVLLMASESDEAVFGALRAGVTGLLPKDADPSALVAAVQAVARGEALLAPGVASRLLADYMSRPERLRSTPEQLEELTSREREVVALVAAGLSNEEIAEQLVVTRATAKTHVSRALCKLHARDRAQLVVLAYEAGLVRPTPKGPGRSDVLSPVRFGRYASTRGRQPALDAVAA